MKTVISTSAARSAKSYFSSRPNSFWNWSEDSTVVTPGGNTIAFYQEVVAVFRALQPHGFPAFDAVAVLLAVCRDNWPGDGGLAEEFDYHLASIPTKVDHSELMSSLLWLHGISRTVRTRLEGKAALAAMVFENWEPALCSDEAAAVIQFLENRESIDFGEQALYHRRRALVKQAQTYDILIDHIQALDADTIEMRCRTGLDTPVSRAPLSELPAVARVRRLIRELKDDDNELSGVASIAFDLMAAVHIPRAVDEPEELPLGGYSDISNRGAPDRLLLTELAQDDDVLAMRVNLNEALYLRREAPPRTPLHERRIVIDVGMRLWGVPRVFATALGLAFCATADEHHPLRVFRAAEDSPGAEAVDLFTRDGLIEQLGALATEPHPGKTLRSAIEEHEYDRNHDLIVVTHPDAFADHEFQQVLRDLALPQVYIALVDSAGAYELLRLSPRGKKRLQRAHCQLDAILNPGSSTAVALLNPDIDPDLPLALRMREFPLLTAHPLNSEHASYHPDIGLACYVRDGRVIFWETPNLGGRMFHCKAKQTPVEWIWLDEARKAVLIVHGADSNHPVVLTRLKLDGSAPVEFALDLDHAEARFAFTYHPAGYLLCAGDGRHISLISIDNGERIASLVLPETARLFGRYLQFVSNKWHAVKVHSAGLSDEPIVASELPKSEILRCFDRQGHEGTHVILKNGCIFRFKPEPSLVHKMPNGVKGVRNISRDGSRILYVDDQDYSRLLDLNLRRFDIIPPRVRHPLQLVEKKLMQLQKRMPTQRKNFRAIIVTPDSELCLITKNSQVMQLQHSPASGFVHLQHLSSRVPGSYEIPFSRIESPFGEHHMLDRAELGDGTRFYLDSRGLLHIVPGDPTLPQAAIVLKDGMLSGWFSDNVWFGDRYFLGKHTPIDSATAYDRLMQYARNLYPFT